MKPTRSHRPGSKSGIPTALTAALALLAGLAIAAGGCRERGVHYEEQSQVTMPLPPQARVLVENARGSVRLVTGDSGSVKIEAHKRAYAMTESKAKALAAEVKVHVDRVGDRLEIHVEYPRRIAGSNVHVEVFGENVARRRADVELIVSIPARVPTRVETRSGELFVEETVGPLEYVSTSGDASIEKHAGPLSVRTTSGDVTASRVDGDFEMNTTSGDLSVRHVAGSLHFDSTSGDLETDDVDGILSAKTVSGDVEAGRVQGMVEVNTTSGDVELRNVPGSIQVRSASGDVVTNVVSAMEHIGVETTSGDIELHLPEELKGRLEVHTSSGEVEAHIPMTLQRATRRQLEAVLGTGPAVTSIQTSSGDIVIALASEKQ